VTDLESESRWNSITWSDWWQSDSVSGNWTNESIGASSETWDVDSESIIESITCSDSIEFDSVWDVQVVITFNILKKKNM
jgi:hypothetical protein